MATWKKVIVSGSSPNFASLQVDNLPSGSVVMGGGSASLSYREVNGTGSILATEGSVGAQMVSASISGSFTGSFYGDGSGLTNLSVNGTRIATGSVSASVDVTGDVFKITSSSLELFTVSSNGGVEHGMGVTASGDYSHAEGQLTQAIGPASHAEGFATIALGTGSHAEGRGTIASGSYQTVVGTYNEQGNLGALFIVGNGVNDTDRSDLAIFTSASIIFNSPISASSLHGTASWAETASYVLTASGIAGGQDGYVALWTGSNQLTSSALYQSGSSIAIWTTSSMNSSSFTVYGSDSTASLVLYAQVSGSNRGFRVFNTFNGISNAGDNPQLANEGFGFAALRTVNSASLSNVNWSTALGAFSMFQAQNLRTSTAVGYTAMGNASGSGTGITGSTAVGAFAMRYQKEGRDNTAIGSYALLNRASAPLSASFNTAVGAYSLYSSSEGGYNTALGGNALYNLTTGDRNLAIGWEAGAGLSTGRANTILGGATGLNPTLSNNIILADGDGNIRARYSSSIWTLSDSTVGDFTGSLFGTASWAQNAISASYISGSGIVTGSFTGSFYGMFSGSAALQYTASNGLGISTFKYNGSENIAIEISGAASLGNDTLPMWKTGSGIFADSSIKQGDEGVLIDNTAGVKVLDGGITVSGSSLFHNNLVVQGDLTVQGTASFQNTNNLLVADQFILLSSGSNSYQDSGIIVNGGSNLSGSALFLETNGAGNYGRWAVQADLNADATTATPDEYMVTAKIDGVPTGNPTWGGATNGRGNMWIDTGSGDIYIWA